MDEEKISDSEQMPQEEDLAKEILRRCGSTTFQLDGSIYTIVASPPGRRSANETATGDVSSSKHKSVSSASSSLSSCSSNRTDTSNETNNATGGSDSQNGQISKQGSLTIVRRSSTKKSPPGRHFRRGASLIITDDESILDDIDLNTDHLPAVDTPDACDKAALRLRCLLRQLQKGEISAELLQKNLRYAAKVLEAVFIDETKEPNQSSSVDIVDDRDPSDTTAGEIETRKSHETLVRQILTSSSSSSKKSLIQRRQLRPPIWARRLVDEDDELSEVQPDAVPPEVREWLASTFTRQLATSRKRTDEKPKFKSVAHAIRAGIFVDRMYRKVTNTTLMQFPPEVVRVLKTIDEWSFDVFDLSETTCNQPLKYLGYDLLNRYGIFHKFKVPPAVVECFLGKIEEGYSKFKNPYHNNLHAADVTQCVHYMLYQTGLMSWLTDLEIFATLIAAIIHDYEHTGTTNNFHVMSGSDTALLYNDRAVLENHHVSSTFRLMKEDECNILQHLSREEYREFRTLVIDMVLATDMSYHFQQLKNMRNLLTLAEPFVDKSKALSLVLHCCDIAHPSKRWDLHRQWTSRLLEEFFQQGDKERDLGLPFSPLCDRNNTLVAESQIGFIDFIVEPSMNVCGDMLEVIVNALSNSSNQNSPASIVTSAPQSVDRDNETSRVKIKKPWVECLTENKKKWREQAAKEDDEANKIKNENEDDPKTDETAQNKITDKIEEESEPIKE